MKLKMEKPLKKRKWKNGLSITPFIKQDAGNVEKGIEHFNASMTTGSPMGPASGNAMSESLQESKMEKIYDGIKFIYDSEEDFQDNHENNEELIDEIFQTSDLEKDSIESIKVTSDCIEVTDKEGKKECYEYIAGKLFMKEDEIKEDLDFNKEESKLEENKMEFKHLHEAEIIKEDLNNVTEVEDKAKEVVDPTFASAVREIRSHDEEREEAKTPIEAPKEGEEVLPKSLKITLDESLFTEEFKSVEEVESALVEVSKDSELKAKVLDLLDKKYLYHDEEHPEWFEEDFKDCQIALDSAADDKESGRRLYFWNLDTVVRDHILDAIDEVKGVHPEENNDITVQEYLNDVKMGEGWVTIEKIEFDIDQAPYSFKVEDVINHALSHGWKLKTLPDGLSLVQKGMHENLKEDIDPYIGWEFEDEDSIIGELESFIYEIRNGRRGAFTDALTYHDLGEYVKKLSDRLDSFGDELLIMREEENVEESINEAELVTRISETEKEFTPYMHLKDAYAIYEPEEFQLDKLRNDITLEDIWKAMQDGEDVYEFASVDGEGFDSAVREGIFNMIERALGIDYDIIYNTWLNN